MKRTLPIAALFAPAACNDAGTGDEQSTDVAAVDAVDPNADAGFEAVAPGKQEIVHADGSIQVTGDDGEKATVRPVRENAAPTA